MSAAVVERPAGRAANMAELVRLRNEAAARVAAMTGQCAASIEWAAVSLEVRMSLMILAGIDGDIEALASRAWLEFTPAERRAVQVQARGVRAELSRLWALVQK